MTIQAHLLTLVPKAWTRGFLSLVLPIVTACTMVDQPQLPSTEDEQQSVVDESNSIELSARRLDLAALALSAFKAQNRNWRCFDVEMYSEGNNWRVNFSPKDDVQQKGGMLVVGASKCGGGVSFIMSDTGKIIRTIYAR